MNARAHAQCCSADGRRQVPTAHAQLRPGASPSAEQHCACVRTQHARMRSNAEFVRKTNAIPDFKKTYLQHKNRVAVFCYKNRTKYGKNVLVGISGIGILNEHIAL